MGKRGSVWYIVVRWRDEGSDCVVVSRHLSADAADRAAEKLGGIATGHRYMVSYERREVGSIIDSIYRGGL